MGILLESCLNQARILVAGICWPRGDGEGFVRGHQSEPTAYNSGWMIGGQEIIFHWVLTSLGITTVVK